MAEPDDNVTTPDLVPDQGLPESPEAVLLVGPDANTTAPWNAAWWPYLKTAESIQVIYTVQTCSTSYGVASWDAVNVELDLDYTRTPYAIASWDVPSQFFDPLAVGGITEVTYPGNSVPVLIKAGYRGGPVATDDLQTLFYGIITSRTWSDGAWHFLAESADRWWNHPTNRSYNVSNTFTKISEVATALTGAATPLRRNLQVYETSLNTPTSTQLGVFREMEFDLGDNLDEWMHSLGDSLGQWIRGDHRNRKGVSFTAQFQPWYLITARWTDRTGAPIDITPLVSKWQSGMSLDDWGNLVEIKVQWSQGGDIKSSDYVWESDYVDGTGVLAVKSLTANVRPFLSGGVRVLDDSWPAGKLLLEEAGNYPGRVSVEARALFWLEPQRMVQLTPPGASSGSVGMIRSMRFLVDQGLMTLECSV